jgi:type I restriction enzyme S subunit
MKWPVAPLFKIVRIVGGGTPAKANSAFWSGEIPWVSPKDMISRDIWETQDHISENAVAESATQLVPAGSVLIVARSGILVRFVPIAIAHVPVTLNQDMKAFLPTTEALDNQFLAYFLESRSSELLASFVKRGATVHSLDMNKLQQLQVPIPAPLEQRRIVQIIDQADALRKKRAEADAKAERIFPALFIRVFGDPTTNQRRWDVFELGDLCAKITSGSRDWARHTGRGNSFFVRTQDINDGEISKDLLTVDPPFGAEADRTRLCYGDVVVTITGIVGKAAVFRVHKQNVYVSQHVALVRPKPTLEPEYLAAYANFPSGNGPLLARFQYGQTKPGLGFRELRTAKIPLPRIDLQRRFVSQTQDIRALKQSQCRAKAKLEELWAALLQRAFSGDLTATWREGHMEELLAEMREQAQYLEAHGTHSQQENAGLRKSLF